MLRFILKPEALNPAKAHLEVFNEGEEAVLVPKLAIGFNRGGEQDGFYFEFDRPLPHISRELSASTGECIELAPGSSHAITVIDLRRFYELPPNEAVRGWYRNGDWRSNEAVFRLDA